MFRFLTQNGRQCLGVGRLRVGQHPAFAPRSVAAQIRSLGKNIRREHNLGAPFIEPLEGVKQFLLGAIFSTEKLNIIDEEYGGLLSIPVAKLRHAAVTQGINQIACELFCGHVQKCASGSASGFGSRSRVGFAKTGVAVNRVVLRFTRSIGRREGRRMSELIGLSTTKFSKVLSDTLGIGRHCERLMNRCASRRGLCVGLRARHVKLQTNRTSNRFFESVQCGSIVRSNQSRWYRLGTSGSPNRC